MTGPATHGLSITWFKGTCSWRLPERHKEVIYQRERHQAIKYKNQAEKAKRESAIRLKDLVMLKTRNLALKAITIKLKARFIGPFQVEAQVGTNAFTLTLPTTMRVHPVFNVSLLQPYQWEYKPPGPVEVEGEAEYKVEKIIHHRSNGKRW